MEILRYVVRLSAFSVFGGINLAPHMMGCVDSVANAIHSALPAPSLFLSDWSPFIALGYSVIGIVLSLHRFECRHDNPAALALSELLRKDICSFRIPSGASEKIPELPRESLVSQLLLTQGATMIGAVVLLAMVVEFIPVMLLVRHWALSLNLQPEEGPWSARNGYATTLPASQ